MSSTLPLPATADRGYITQPGPLENTYTSDASLQRALSWYLPASILRSAEPDLTQLGADAVSERVREWSADSERNQPYVKSHNVWGKRYDYDRLVTSEGWKQLGKWGAQRRIVSTGYESTLGPHRRTVQYALNYLYSPSSGLYSCPMSMTDGAAFILAPKLKALPLEHPFHEAFKRLISDKDDHWTSGQWMTERAGGSDVQNTETWATYAPVNSASSEPLADGDYLINGFKFFSSATDANVALLLAKTPSGKLSTFLAPLRKTIIGDDGMPREVSNGVRIHRLKNKLGTKELPTAELELKDMRAHLVGELDQGVMTIAPLLNITRVHTFVGSLGGWRRAIIITKNFAKARTTVGEPLWLIPMHLRLLADLEVKHRGSMNLAFFTIAVMGLIENDVSSEHAHLPRRGKEAIVVFRALTATAKAVISKMAVAGIQECQESMGGVGYMDEADEPEFNISRILRNTLVNSIWEGTTNVLASELIRFFLKKDNFEVFAAWLSRTLTLIQTSSFRDALTTAWSVLQARFSTRDQAPTTVLADARRYMFTLAWILMGGLLAVDAERDNDPVTTEIAHRWILNGEGGVGDTVFRDIVTVRANDSVTAGGEEHLQWDCKIAWGIELPVYRASGHRSLQNAGSKL